MTSEKQQTVMCNLLEIDMTSLIQYARKFFGKFCVRTTWMIPNKMSYITYVYPLKLNNKDSRTTALCKKTPS